MTMRVDRTDQPARAPAAVMTQVEEAVAVLGTISIDALRARWRQELRAEPPAGFTKDLLARALADRLQTKAFGGLSAKTAKLLREFGQGIDPPRYIKVGSVIVREYGGVLHEVVVVPGGFLWQGKTFESLSTIAKRITGTTWNGPRFFGLRGKANAGVEASGQPLDDAFGGGGIIPKRPHGISDRSAVSRKRTERSLAADANP